VRDRKFPDSRVASIITILFLSLLPLIFFWRETLGRATLGDQDAVFWFFPAYRFVAEQIKSGSLPLWSPYLYSGSPLFSQWQAGVLDPINWIYLVETTSRTLTLSLEISFAISLLATFIYTRSLGFKRRSSVFSAIIYALSGFAVGRTLYPGFLHIIALTPLVIFFVERLSHRGRWRDAACGALIVAWQIFAAHPQPLVYSSLLAGAYALFCAFIRREERREYGTNGNNGKNGKIPGLEFSRFSRYFRLFRILSSDLESASSIKPGKSRILFLTQFSFMFVVGAALASIQLIPAWETAGKSVRQDWPYELFTLHSLHPVSLLTTLFPFFHGSGKLIYRMPYWGVYWHHNEAQIYLGLTAMSLAIAGAIFAWRCRYRIEIFWSIVAVAGIILSLGKYAGPVARILYHIPLLSHFRSPNRHWMEVVLAVAVLSGYAVDRLLRDDSPVLARQARIAAAGLALLCCVAGGLVLWRKELAERLIRRLPELGDLTPGFLGSAGLEFYLPVIMALSALSLSIGFTRSHHRGLWYWPLLIFLVVDFHLYAVFAPINNHDKLETLIGRAIPANLVAKQSETEPIRYHVMLDTQTGEFSPFWFYGHEMSTGYDPMLNERYKIFSGIDEAGHSFTKTMFDPQDRTLDILNVKYVLVPPLIHEQYRDRLEPSANNTPRWRELAERIEAAPYRGFRIFENLKMLPRAWLVERVQVAYEGDQLKLIRGEVASTGERDFNPAQAALVDHETAARLENSLVDSAPETIERNHEAVPAKIIERSSTSISVETEMTGPSVLVLSEVDDSGWRAKVDGKTADLIRVNYYLRGIALPGGKHGVEIAYQPRSLTFGAVVSVTTALCLLVIVLWEWRRSNIVKGVDAEV
jgi:hypothetical protein